ncbi:MAG: hypothetical protein E6J89_03760, partial [Deltaproteobacteria bacterium]
MRKQQYALYRFSHDDRGDACFRQPAASAGDQRSSGNMMKPETVLRAAKLIKTGEVFELAAVLSPDPKEAFINANRVFNIYTKPALPVANARVANEELVVTELGQIGTQFDAFAHQMWGDSFYNCF